MTQPLSLTPQFPTPEPTGNECPPGWVELAPDARVADIAEAIGGVVGTLRRWNIEPHFPDDLAPVKEAMAAVLRLLDVEPADIKFESYVVA